MPWPLCTWNTKFKELILWINYGTLQKTLWDLLTRLCEAFASLCNWFVSRLMADKTHIAKSIRSDLFADKRRRSEAPWSSTGVAGSSTERTVSSVDGESFISACNWWIDFDNNLHLQSFASPSRAFTRPSWSFASPLRAFSNFSRVSRKELFTTYCI